MKQAQIRNLTVSAIHVAITNRLSRQGMDAAQNVARHLNELVGDLITYQNEVNSIVPKLTVDDIRAALIDLLQQAEVESIPPQAYMQVLRSYKQEVPHILGVQKSFRKCVEDQLRQVDRLPSEIQDAILGPME
jgi:hypothetical protein